MLSIRKQSLAASELANTCMRLILFLTEEIFVFYSICRYVIVGMCGNRARTHIHQRNRRKHVVFGSLFFSLDVEFLRFVRVPFLPVWRFIQ